MSTLEQFTESALAESFRALGAEPIHGAAGIDAFKLPTGAVLPWRAPSTEGREAQLGAGMARVVAEAAQRVAAVDADSTRTHSWKAEQRARIAAARGEATQRYEATEKACWQRFAVNDCRATVRDRYREPIRDLRAQVNLLNDAERQKRGLDRMDATEDKLRQSERKAEENAARAANDPGRAPKDASSPTAPKRAPLAAGDPDPAPKGPGGKPRNNEARAPKAPPEPIDLKAKLVEQRERQSRADKRRAERKSAPLPPPDAP